MELKQKQVRLSIELRWFVDFFLRTGSFIEGWVRETK